MPLLEATGLVKRYGTREALRDVSVAATEGERVAVIGPNGAGKTTLLSILAGIIGADEGEVHLPRGEVGWVPQQAALYGKLTVAENLRLFARLEQCADVDSAVSRMLEQAGLDERANDQVSV
ncbi:MAG: ATP-binding cassette domain-containing protein, partial [Thermoleophilaceae bacterium]